MAGWWKGRSWGVIAFAGTGVGLLVAGVALAGLAALIFSGKLEEIGNAAGKVVDALIDPRATGRDHCFRFGQCPYQGQKPPALPEQWIAIT